MQDQRQPETEMEDRRHWKEVSKRLSYSNRADDRLQYWGELTLNLQAGGD